MEQAIVALGANKDALLELLGSDKFSATNISSILSGSAAQVDQAILALWRTRRLA